MHGASVYTCLRTRYKATSLHLQVLREQCKQAGIEDFITKVPLGSVPFLMLGEIRVWCPVRVALCMVAVLSCNPFATRCAAILLFHCPLMRASCCLQPFRI